MLSFLWGGGPLCRFTVMGSVLYIISSWQEITAIIVLKNIQISLLYMSSVGWFSTKFLPPFSPLPPRSEGPPSQTNGGTGLGEEICRGKPHNFFSSSQFQRKRKSLVFFQSINFLWLHVSMVVLEPGFSSQCLEINQS